MVDVGLREARCGCGALRVTVRGEPDVVVMCSCIACQRRTGSPFGQGAYFAKDAIVSIDGVYRRFARRADSGRGLENGFCPECGTNLFWTLEMRPTQIAIAVGCFGDPAFPGPDRAVFCATRHDWLPLPDDLPRFEALAPKLGKRQD